jgi:hypothetical protein
MSVFPRFCFVLSHFRVFISHGGVKIHQTYDKEKKTRRICFTKTRQKSKTVFFSVFCLSSFWAFLGEGSKEIPPKNLTLVLFWPLTHPPTTGVTDYFWAAPCHQVSWLGRSRASAAAGSGTGSPRSYDCPPLETGKE